MGKLGTDVSRGLLEIIQRTGVVSTSGRVWAEAKGINRITLGASHCANLEEGEMKMEVHQIRFERIKR